MKIGTVTYCPPRGVQNSESFFANLQKFPAKNPLYLFSDDASWNPSHLIKSPESVGRRPAWGINNFIFLQGLELAREVGLDFFLYIESDSRVGCKWFDDIIFTELFTRYPNGVASAGSPVVWDLNSGGREFALRVVEMAWKYQQAGDLPMSFYSGKHPFDSSGAALYVNGSCAIYETAAMSKVFDLDNPTVDISMLARRTTAYDLEIGRRLWTYHGPKAIDHVGWLVSAYSAFGNAVTTETERWEMLTSGKKVLAHQFKGPA